MYRYILRSVCTSVKILTYTSNYTYMLILCGGQLLIAQPMLNSAKILQFQKLLDIPLRKYWKLKILLHIRSTKMCYMKSSISWGIEICFAINNTSKMTRDGQRQWLISGIRHSWFWQTKKNIWLLSSDFGFRGQLFWVRNWH